ncbi:MAG: sodium:calcium antiporter [Candidatus Dormibacteraeota bacterium]|nr:sodium:calcium antiporter [Candidatus Dormibacteraeota bacterium]
MGVAALFLAGLLLMLAAAALFTNAVEWVAGEFGLGHALAGTVLAAIGTALPESIVPVVALIGGGRAAAATATGAILGAPFMLATVGLGLTGVVCLISGRTHLLVPGPSSRAVLYAFLGSYLLLIAGAFVPTPVRWADAALLAGLYALFVRRSLRDDRTSGESEETLLAARLLHRPGGGLALGAAQLLVALVTLALASELFILALEGIAPVIRLSALVLALLLVPLATELPELVAGSLWVARGRDLLALGNVTGAMVFQATVPAIIGLCFTPWDPSGIGFLAAAVTISGALVALAATGKRGVDARVLAPAGLGLYALYVVAVILGRA